MTRYHLLLAFAALAGGVVVLFSSGVPRWLLLSAVCSLCGLLVGLGVSFPQFQLFGESLCRVPISEKVTVLTFDDGPDPESTPALLDLLARRQVRATFFCVGERVVRHRKLAQRIVAEGHAVENHSFAHSAWTNLLPQEKLRADLARAQAEIATVTGRAPVFFRPPMTLTNQRVFRVARALSLRVVGYTIRGYDRRPGSASAVLQRVRRGLRPGAIILLHDGGVPKAQLVELVDQVLDFVGQQGYSCRRLDELAASSRHL